MTYKEAVEAIEQIKMHKSTTGTGGLKELCLRLGEPQASLRFISVMGVTGRKAVTAYLGAVLKSMGCKVGSYCLSSVTEERERIQLNGRPITKQGFSDCLERVLEAVCRMEEEGCKKPALWEIETAVAFLYFQEDRLKREKEKGENTHTQWEVVLWEGAYPYLQEMTEVLPAPIAMVYTAIHPDQGQHTSEIPEEIAAALAKFMKASVPVFSAPQLPEAEEVLRQQTKALGCSFHVVDKAQLKKVKYGLEKQRFTYKDYTDMEIGVGGMEEIEHAVLALEALGQLGVMQSGQGLETVAQKVQSAEIMKQEKGHGISQARLRKALLQVKWDGGMALLKKKPYFITKEVSNEREAEELVAALRQFFPNKRMIYIFSSLRTMEYEAVIRRTFELAAHIITLTVRGDAEGMHAYELAGEVLRYHPGATAVDSPEEAMELAQLLADKDGVIVAFGALECLTY